VDTTIAAVAGRVPVVVGASDLTTAGTVARSEYAQQAGATAVMVIPVSYWALNEREIVQHYTSVSDAISIPVMAYNNPATSGVDMSPTLLNRMFEEIANVKMVKESTGDIQRMLDLKEFSSGALPFYNGSNPLVLKALLAGATGWCTAAPCLRPVPAIALYEAVAAGNTDRAQEIYDELSAAAQLHRVQGTADGCEVRTRHHRRAGRCSAAAAAPTRSRRSHPAGVDSRGRLTSPSWRRTSGASSLPEAPPRGCFQPLMRAAGRRRDSAVRAQFANWPKRFSKTLALRPVISP
jgi:dihydrodipicolinate synthase/N-acetylneuraminate lyase